MTPYYEELGITIYHGDCREVVPSLGAAYGLLIVDPPYGIGHASNRVCPTTTAAWMNRQIAYDMDSTIRDIVLTYATEWVCFGTMKHSAPVGAKGVLIWDKGPASGMGDLSWPWKLSYELMFLCGDRWQGPRDEGVVKGYHVVTRASMGRTHPNEKPVGLLKYLLRRHSALRVLDPCMGSGVTLEAAKFLGRQAIGIDIDEQCCEIAVNRLRQGVLPLAIGV